MGLKTAQILTTPNNAPPITPDMMHIPILEEVPLWNQRTQIAEVAVWMQNVAVKDSNTINTPRKMMLGTCMERPMRNKRIEPKIITFFGVSLR